MMEEQINKLMKRIYRLFAIRDRSEKEIRDYFKLKNYKLKIKNKEQFSNLAIEALIEKLKQLQMINDEQFTKKWIESRRRSKKLGIKAIKQELFQKGIDRELVNKLLSNQAIEQVSEGQLAQQALERKMKAWQNLKPLEFKKKAFGFLGRKGFEYDVINKTVENFLRKNKT